LKTSTIILAGGPSRRFGEDKGLALLAGKPLIAHIADRVDGLTDEIITVVSSPHQREAVTRILDGRVRVVVDELDVRSPLVGAAAGFRNARGEYSLLLPCDTPFVSREVLSLLLEISPGVNAVIPRWPNGYVEPLQAVYRTRRALQAAEETIRMGRLDMRSMISLLRRVRYVSTLVLKQLDPNLTTFFNLNTPQDLRRAEILLQRG